MVVDLCSLVLRCSQALLDRHSVIRFKISLSFYLTVLNEFVFQFDLVLFSFELLHYFTSHILCLTSLSVCNIFD